MGDAECEMLGCHHARFGMSLTKLGDVNNDGYQGQCQPLVSSDHPHSNDELLFEKQKCVFHKMNASNQIKSIKSL